MVDVLAAHVSAPETMLEESVTEFAGSQSTLTVDDLAASRGDGVFETLAVVDGRVQASEAHLDRLVRSAELLDLARPHRAQWRYALDRAARAVPAGRTGVLKLVLSRGREGSPRPTGWIAVSSAPSAVPERRTGVRVVTLDRGVSSTAASESPWLLLGAKSLSYATNMAALREAARRGAQDVIYTSTDGYVLEGPTSSVLARIGGRIVTPAVEAGVLPGTTQHDAFVALDAERVETAAEPVPVSALAEADAIWLASSVRLLVPVVALDGRPVPQDAELTDRINAVLLAR